MEGAQGLSLLVKIMGDLWWRLSLPSSKSFRLDQFITTHLLQEKWKFTLLFLSKEEECYNPILSLLLSILSHTLV